MAKDPNSSEHRTERRLTAILAADIFGYSALMGADEEATVRDLKGHQSVLLPLIARNSGRVIDTAGDGILAEFHSVLQAVKCAMVMQDVMEHRNSSVVPSRRMLFRIGVNQGDVIADGVRVYGDGVNIAARLETICQPGGLCISGKVYDEVRGKIDLACEDIGEQTLKNIAHPVRAYRVQWQRGPIPELPAADLAQSPSPAVRVPPTEVAPLEIGGYTRAATDHYIGQYLTVRPSFSGNGTIYCYCTTISWSDGESCLVFEESGRPEKQYQHTGRLYMPPNSMFIHLVSLTRGAMRTVLVSQMGQTREMRGLITTLANDTGAMFIPACAPIVYLRRDSLDGQTFGRLTPDDAGFEEFRTLLQETVRKSFVRMVGAT